MQLTYAQTVALACVASATLSSAMPRKMRSGPSNGAVALAEGAGALGGALASNVINGPRAVENVPLPRLRKGQHYLDNARSAGVADIQTREPRRGGGARKGPSTRASALAQGAGALGGAIASNALNQQRDELVTREPRKGRVGGPTHGATVLAEGAGALGGAVASNIINQQRDLEGELFRREPRRGRSRISGSSSNVAELIGTPARVAPPMIANWNAGELINRRAPRGGHGRISGSNVAQLIGTAASAAAPMIASRDIEEDIYAREPRRGHAHISGSNIAKLAGTAASAAAPMIANRDVEDELFIREPRRGRGRGRFGGGIMAGASAGEAAAPIDSRDFEGKLFTREPRRGHGRGRFGSGMAGSAASDVTPVGSREVHEGALYSRWQIEELD